MAFVTAAKATAVAQYGSGNKTTGHKRRCSQEQSAGELDVQVKTGNDKKSLQEQFETNNKGFVKGSSIASTDILWLPQLKFMAEISKNDFTFFTLCLNSMESQLVSTCRLL